MEIRHLVRIEAPARDVYRALTERDRLAGWWTEDTSVEDGGHQLLFRFGRDHRHRMRVVDRERDRRVEWECAAEGEPEPEWRGTRLRFELEPRGEHTRLRFSHTGWKVVNNHVTFCNTVWSRALRSLQQLCETGRGEPLRIPRSGAS